MIGNGVGLPEKTPALSNYSAQLSEQEDLGDSTVIKENTMRQSQVVMLETMTEDVKEQLEDFKHPKD